MLFRIIDANINRVSEGLRVIEDVQRFIYENQLLAKRTRRLRHLARKSFDHKELLKNRNAIEDVGFNISREDTLDKKSSIEELLISNFKRVEEGLRSIEESLKVMGFYEKSKVYESIRFQTYDLEKVTMLKKTIPNTDIYAILGEEFSRGRSNIEVVKELIQADVRIIQYREKDKSKREQYEECKEIRELTRKNGITFIVNDNVSIALAVKADGIHIGQDDMDIDEVRPLASDMVIGVSTHNKDQARMAIEKGVDYIGVGPIFNTNTKKDIEKSEGLNYLKWVEENIDIPYVAIGGIKEKNINLAKDNGGYCFAMISEIVGAEDIVEKVKLIRKKLKKEF